MNVLGIRQDLKAGLSIDEVCSKYDVNFYELCHTLKRVTPVFHDEKDFSKYIYHKNGRYVVQRTTSDGVISYGSYFDFDEAVKVKNELVRKDWNVDPMDYLGDKWITNNCGGFAITKKDDTGKSVFYGRWKSLSFARKVRDCLVEFDWDKDYLPLILKRLEGAE